MKLSASEFFRNPLQDVAVEPRLPQSAFPLHDHDFDEIAVVLQGSGWHEINAMQEIVSVGDVLFIRSSDRHKFHSVTDLRLINILYRPGLLEAHDSGVAAEVTARRDPTTGIAQWQVSEAGLAEIRPILRMLRHESASGEPFCRSMAGALFLQLNIALLRQQSRGKANDPSEDIGVSAVRFMRAHYAAILRIDDVARAFGVSSSQFNRKFRTSAGLSPHSFLISLRITQAMRELKNNRDSITDIAFRCGFNDSNYFSSCFTTFAGVSPSRYRYMAS